VGGGDSRSLFSISLFSNINLKKNFQKCIYQKVSEIVINHNPLPHPRAKEGDSYDHGRGFGYDHGRGFIVRILGGLKRETVIAMVRIS
jgi:hypothetical protein